MKQRTHRGKDISCYDPDLFIFPILGQIQGSRIKFQLEYTQTLSYNNGSYDLNIPLTISKSLFSQRLQRAILVDIKVVTGEICSDIGIEYVSRGHSECIERGMMSLFVLVKYTCAD